MLGPRDRRPTLWFLAGLAFAYAIIVVGGASMNFLVVTVGGLVLVGLIENVFAYWYMKRHPRRRPGGDWDGK